MSLIRYVAKQTLCLVLPARSILARGTGDGIALTFDDGPHPKYTPRLLDALGEANVRATFFVIGEKAAQHKEILKRIGEEGHEVGNHSWSHTEPRYTSASKLLEEIRRTRDFICDLTGKDCRLFRPPKGELTLHKLWALVRNRQTIVLWNKDTKDYCMKPGSGEMKEWWNRYEPAGGDIILMHDNHPHAISAIETLHNLRHARRTVSAAVAAVRTVTREFADSGFCTVSELLDLQNKKVDRKGNRL